MEEELRSNLATLTASFTAATGRASGGVLAAAVKDARFLERTLSGRTFTVRLYDRALAWFDKHWPQDLAWPSHIDRPRCTTPPRAA